MHNGTPGWLHIPASTTLPSGSVSIASPGTRASLNATPRRGFSADWETSSPKPPAVCPQCKYTAAVFCQGTPCVYMPGRRWGKGGWRWLVGRHGPLQLVWSSLPEKKKRNRYLKTKKFGVDFFFFFNIHFLATVAKLAVAPVKHGGQVKVPWSPLPSYKNKLHSRRSPI